MAHYTVLDEQAIKGILNHYGLTQNGTAKVLSGGSENTNYKVPTDQGSIVLTICEQKSAVAAKELASLLVYLQEQGFATSRIIKTNSGKLTITHDQKPVMIKAFLEGKVMEYLPENLLVSLGRDLARLHQISPPNFIPGEISFGIQNFHKVAVYAPGSGFDQWLLETKNYVNQYMSADLPMALIHSDIFYNNIIVSEDQQCAQIMDFEEACHYYRIFDIGMMLIGSCCNAEGLRMEQAAALLKGYQQEISLLPSEKAALQAFSVYAAAATAFWRHQNFNHIKPDPAMYDHYQAMQKLADKVREIPENQFMEILASPHQE